MKERPILFSAPMVRAILNGTKTQTRRAYKVRKHPDAGCEMAASELAREPQHVIDRICPYGQPGDRLWVRETWANVGTMDPGLTVYRADYPACVPAGYENVPPADAITWKPSIHMFRKDSRILLEVTGVRVERLQDISEADAIAEGIEGCDVVINGRSQGKTWRDHTLKCDDPCEWFSSPIDSYRTLWESINGAGSWEANPWVWVIEFRRIEAIKAAA